MNLVRDLDDSAAVPVLTGCTASGKTGVLLKLRRKYDFEVINADSRQIYRGMDIGTAKPDEHERSLLVHHLIDCIDPDESFSAGRFSREAWRLIHEIKNRDSIPLIAGGTALYLMALTGSLDTMPGRCDGVRDGLKILEAENPGILHRMLEKLDPRTSGKIGEHDVKRHIRALELYILTGKLPSTLRKGGDPSIRDKFRIVGISLPKEEHRRRIRVRAESMIRLGLIDEVKSLLDKGWGRESIVGRTIGYTEAIDYLEGTVPSLEETVDAIAVNTWHLARRQKNMFKRIKGILWVNNDPEVIGQLLFGEGGC